MEIRRPGLLALVLLTGGCEPSSKVAVPTTVVDEQPPAEASRPAPNKARAAQNPSLVDVTAEEMYVGRVIANAPLSEMYPSEYCVEEDKTLYKGAAFRMGTFNVFGVDEALATLKKAGVVALVAKKKPSLFSRLKSAGPCPSPYQPVMAQMRSDWVPPEGGPNTTRVVLERLAYLEASTAQPVDMFEVLDSDEESVRVRVRNPFTLSLAGLRFTSHYEGGPGKPQPTYLEETLGLEPGQWAELELPRHVPGEPARTKSGSALRSLELHGQLGKATLAIELFVPQS